MGAITVPGRGAQHPWAFLLHTIPGHPCPSLCHKTGCSDRKVCIFCHVQGGARCCAEPQELVLGCAGVQSCFISQVCSRSGIGPWLNMFSLPFFHAGNALHSPAGQGSGADSPFLQLCSAVGKGLGLRLFVCFGGGLGAGIVHLALLPVPKPTNLHPPFTWPWEVVLSPAAGAQRQHQTAPWDARIRPCLTT